MIKRRIFSSFIFCALIASTAPAATPAETITPLLSDSTVAVARIDLNGIDLPAMEKAAIDGVGKNQAIDARQREARVVDIKATFASAQKWVKAMNDAGGQEVYLLFDIHQLNRAGPILAVPVAAGANVVAITNLLTTGDAATPGAARNPQTVGGQIANLVVVAPKAWIDQRAAAKPVDRPSVAQAFGVAGDAPLSLVLAPTESVRRELENRMGALPAELGGGPITDVSRGVEWATISIAKAPANTGQLLIQTPNPEAAQKLEEILNTGIDLMLQNPEFIREIPNAKEVVNAARPELKGQQLVSTLGAGMGINELVGQFGVKMIRDRGAAYTVKSASNMRMMTLGLMMYANEHNDAMPDKLEECKKYINANDATFALLMTNPAAPDRRVGYVYVKPFEGKRELIRDPQNRLVLHETYDKWPGQVNVAFADGHVEMIKDQARFDKLLKEAQPPAAAMP